MDTSVRTRTAIGESAIAHHGIPFGGIPTTLTPEGWTPGHYPSESAAVAAIKSAGTAGAVFLEEGQYAAYHVSGETTFSDFTLDNLLWFPDKPWSSLRFDSPATVIVSDDGAEVRPSQFTTKDEAKTRAADQALMPGGGQAAVDPFVGYKAAFDLTKPAPLEMAFLPAMRDNALTVLASTRIQVARDIERRAGGAVPAEEIATMRKTAEYLAGLDAEIDGIDKSPPMTPEEFLVFQENKRRFDALQARRRVVLARYPMLARITPRNFVQLSPEEQVSQLGGASQQVLADIDKTRSNILEGSLNLWKINALVESTLAGLGVTDPVARQRIRNLAAANQSSIADDILTLFTVAFGIGAGLATGGLGLALAAGALGLGVVDAIKQTEEIFAENSAANTDLDPALSLLPPEDARSYGWVVLAWVGVVADATQVVSALRAVKAADGALEAGVRVLSGGDEALAGRLRVAAGLVDAGEKITEATRAGLARRLGTTIEIDATLGPRVVEVHYAVEETGRIAVRGVRCGTEATAGELLAHAATIKALRRYDGLLGKLRELVDKMRSLAGFPPPGVNPFPPGSQAFESFFELEKLPGIVELRRSALQSVLGTADEPILRQEIEFLESQLVHHDEVVRQLVTEKGVGFIAAAGDETKKVIDSGKMPALKGNPLVSDPSAYYYQVNPGGNPPYWIKRFANRSVTPLTIVSDGAGGWKIAAGELSRAEEALALVAGWGAPEKAAFDWLVEANRDIAFRVVPLRGVAATGQRIGELMTNAQKVELHDILALAFAKDPDPIGRATTVVQELMSHQITVVQGTDQLRAFGYRLAWETAHGPAQGELHHLIPLYLGGDHRKLVDVVPELHDRLHRVVDSIRIEEGLSLAPSSIQNAKKLNFGTGAGILYKDGRVQLVRIDADGTRTFLL
ncbi:MAG: hypothetical protein ACOC84_03970 [Actinomycetota bacterium]